VGKSTSAWSSGNGGDGGALDDGDEADGQRKDVVDARRSRTKASWASSGESMVVGEAVLGEAEHGLQRGTSARSRWWSAAEEARGRAEA
jgi:hypothetical protein